MQVNLKLSKKIACKVRIAPIIESMASTHGPSSQDSRGFEGMYFRIWAVQGAGHMATGKSRSAASQLSTTLSIQDGTGHDAQDRG